MVQIFQIPLCAIGIPGTRGFGKGCNRNVFTNAIQNYRTRVNENEGK